MGDKRSQSKSLNTYFFMSTLHNIIRLPEVEGQSELGLVNTTKTRRKVRT